MRFCIKITAAFATIALACYSTFALDWFVGYWSPAESVTDNLVFQPNRTIDYDMLEFTFEVRTNNLGFRGPPLNPANRSHTRLIGVGDSYMLGWGVNDEQTWLRVLERELQSQGHDIECMNLGRVGGGTPEFVTVLERALPRLRPDIVLLGLPQRATVSSPPSVPFGKRARSKLQNWRYRLYPNIMAKLEGSHAAIPVDNNLIQVQSGRLRARLTENQRARLVRLDERLPDALEAGKLPPALLWLIDQEAGSTLVPPEMLSPTAALLQTQVQNLADELRPIKMLCDSFSARLVVLVYPVPKFCSQEINENYAKLGFNIVPEQLTTDTPDLIAQNACEALDVTCVVVSKPFREAAAESLPFFPLDGHLNLAGNEMLAHLLVARAIQWIADKE